MNAVIETTDRNDLASAEIALQEARAEADAERSKILDAEQDLVEAERTLETRRSEFKARPTVTNGTARMVAEQVLENAKESVLAARDASQPAIKGERLAQARVTYVKLLGAVEAYPACVSQTVDCIVELEESLRKLVTGLERQNREYVEQLKQVNSAAGSLGLPELPMQVQGPDTVRARIKQTLRAKYGETKVVFGEVQSQGFWLNIQ